MVDLVNFKELLKHGRTIKVGNIGCDLVGFYNVKTYKELDSLGHLCFY